MKKISGISSTGELPKKKSMNGLSRSRGIYCSAKSRMLARPAGELLKNTTSSAVSGASARSSEYDSA